MAFDYRKLCGLIVEKVGSQRAFCKKMNISERTMSLKVTGKREFKPSEIVKACEILEIEEKDIPLYFFTLKVQ